MYSFDHSIPSKPWFHLDLILASYVQRDSVRNQREHLILFLANVHIRLEPKPEPLSKVCSLSQFISVVDHNSVINLIYYATRALLSDSQVS